ncbi:MAG: aldehyde dehydrogenase [Pseudomonadota bacterium]
MAVAGVLSLSAFHSNGFAMASTDASEEEEDYNGILVNEPGADTTFAYCAGCHSERIVAQQGLTREGWEELIEWMIEEQGMGEIEDPDYTEIVDYLTAHYGEDRPNFPN